MSFMKNSKRRAAGGDRRLTVLYSVPAPSRASNPYTTMLAEGVARSANVEFFSWKTALLSRYDVLHVHWPETMVRGKGRVTELLRSLAGVLLLLRLSASKIKVVRTVHNLDAHEAGSLLEKFFVRRLETMESRRIYLNAYDVGMDAHDVVIPHGHYRSWEGYGPSLSAAEVSAGRANLLYFGGIRPYKGVEQLIEVYRSDTARVLPELVVAGSSPDEALSTALRRLAQADGRVTLRLERVSDSDLSELIQRADAVVLPYRKMYNSGALLLALSLGTPVIVPDVPVNRALVSEFGEEWVCLVDSFSLETLSKAVEGFLAKPRPTGPDMSGREWADAVDAHLGVYNDAVSA